MSNDRPDIRPERLYQYDSPCSEYTHPYQVFAIAKSIIKDLKVDFDSLSILEVGCATGGNLIPIARCFPNAKCIGIDPFVAQIEVANAKIQKIGIKNIELYSIGIEALDEALPNIRFDLIICHGILSWIPKDPRDHLFEYCSAFLKDQGLLYVSYNLYPAWHLKKPARDLMRFHVAQIQKREPITQAIADQYQKQTHQNLSVEALERRRMPIDSRMILKTFSHQNALKDGLSLKSSYQKVLDDVSGFPDYYLMHEYLLDDNQPYYFHEIIEKAKSNKLQYLADASINTHFAFLTLDAQILQYLDRICETAEDFFQYTDFLFTLYLRRSIFVKQNQSQNQSKSLSIMPNKEQLWQMLVNNELYSSYRFKGQISAEGYLLFESYLPGKQKAQIKQIFNQAFLLILSQHQPKSLKFESLLKLAFELAFELASDTQVPKYVADQLTKLAKKPIESLKLSDFDEATIKEFQWLCLMEVINIPMIKAPAIASEMPTYPKAFEDLQSTEIDQKLINNAYHLVLPTEPQINQFLNLANGQRSIEEIFEIMGISDINEQQNFSEKIIQMAVLSSL
jgi:SAM-dependent methyltransferase